MLGFKLKYFNLERIFGYIEILALNMPYIRALRDSCHHLIASLQSYYKGIPADVPCYWAILKKLPFLFDHRDSI